MKDELTFMVLDGGLLMVACGCLTIFHPAIWFKFMSKRKENEEKQGGDWELSSAEGLTQSR
jgi:hypothetical protein